MQPALWVSKTGLAAQDTALRAISNNLATVSYTHLTLPTNREV